MYPQSLSNGIKPHPDAAEVALRSLLLSTVSREPEYNTPIPESFFDDDEPTLQFHAITIPHTPTTGPLKSPAVAAAPPPPPPPQTRVQTNHYHAHPRIATAQLTSALYEDVARHGDLPVSLYVCQQTADLLKQEQSLLGNPLDGFLFVWQGAIHKIPVIAASAEAVPFSIVVCVRY
jgi:hypothetical protein